MNNTKDLLNRQTWHGYRGPHTRVTFLSVLSLPYVIMQMYSVLSIYPGRAILPMYSFPLMQLISAGRYLLSHTCISVHTYNTTSRSNNSSIATQRAAAEIRGRYMQIHARPSYSSVQLGSIVTICQVQTGTIYI